MSEPDYNTLYFEKDISWEELCEWAEDNRGKGISIKVNSFEIIIGYANTDKPEIIFNNDKEMEAVFFDYKNKICTFKSFNAIQEAIEVIIRGVK